MGFKEKMTELADAVRAVSGVTDKLTVKQMRKELISLSEDVKTQTGGDSIVIDDFSYRSLINVTLYGRTSVLTETPTPDNPVQFVNVGDKGYVTLTVNDKSTEIQLPYPLRGIPVTEENGATTVNGVSGRHPYEDYRESIVTDTKGRKWICDEIDFEQKTHIQRVAVLRLTSDLPWTTNDFLIPPGYEWLQRFCTRLDSKIKFWGRATRYNGKPTTFPGLCTHFNPCIIDSVLGYMNTDDGDCTVAYSLSKRFNPPVLYVRYDACETLDDFKRFLDNNEVYIVDRLADYITTPLTDEQLAAYELVYACGYPLTVSNDEKAYMTIKHGAIDYIINVSDNDIDMLTTKLE